MGLIFLVYSNTLDASWHLDDYQNITHDARLHLNDLTLDSLWNATISFLQNPRDARPLSRLTFTVNWYFGQNDPFGYHLVNISVHVLTAFFLFLTLADLLKLADTAGAVHQHRYLIALLSATLWAFNPIQTQAVTYIVQRMAALATMFYILGIYLYIKGRTSDIPLKKALLFLSCFLSAVCAIASKENAATLPIALLLVEFLFFQNLSHKRTRNIFLGTTIAAGLAIVGFGGLIFFRGDFQSLLNYNFRYFSPLERLLTEPRVVLYYLSQIFYPVPTRLSIEHDIAVSTSLFNPWTTLPAIIMVSCFVGIGLLYIRRRPILSFAILFFSLNHAIESSIIGLELVFEHRNYLPSLFLFVPIAIGIIGLLDYYREKNKLVHRAIITCVILIIAGFGTGTYIRNLAWQSEKSLWEDAITKAPNSGRAWHNLALSYYVPTGQFEKAMVLYRKALTLEKNNIHQESIIYSNMAAGYHYRGNYKRAAQYWTKALNSQSNDPKIKYMLCLALIKMGNYETASKYLEQLVSKYPEKTEVLNLRGILAVLQSNYRQGLSYFRKCFKRKNRPPGVFVNAGAAYSLSGNFQQAERFFKTYLAQQPNDKITLLWLIQNSIKNGDSQQADIYMDRLIRLVPVKDLLAWLRELASQTLYNDTMIAPEVDPQNRGRLSKILNHTSGREIRYIQKNS
jgi:Tfp pilus assembly protein PilF